MSNEPLRRQKGAPTPIGVKDAARLHQDKWILVEVTEFDEYRHPSKGIVLAASKSESRITKELAKQRKPSSVIPPGNPFYIFHASHYYAESPGEIDSIADGFLITRKRRRRAESDR